MKTADWIESEFERLAQSPEGIPKLREFVLQLAVQGKLVAQDSKDEPASELLKRIAAEKEQLVKDGKIKKSKPLPDIEEDEIPFEIPKSWEWTMLAVIGAISPRIEATDETDASFVPMPMVFAEYGKPNESEVRKWGKIKKGYTHFAEGDVGLAKITPCFQNGKSTVFRNLSNGIGAGTTELHVVRPIYLESEYILLFLKTPNFIKTGIPKMTGTAGQKRVPSDYFAFSPFPLPPIAEQKRIVAKVDELMALCDQLEARLTTAQDLRQNLTEAVLHPNHLQLAHN